MSHVLSRGAEKIFPALDGFLDEKRAEKYFRARELFRPLKRNLYMGLDARALEILKRDFEQVVNGRKFLELLADAPPVWHERPHHFHLWLARKKARLTQKQLAERGGVDQALVARVERGRDVRLSTMRKLYAALGYRMLIVPLKMSS